jgi:hypothetical protein
LATLRLALLRLSNALGLRLAATNAAHAATVMTQRVRLLNI